jgi:hypothetical protein
MEAHGHALRRDAPACLAAMRRAGLALGAACDDARPPWLEYFDGAYLAVKFADAFHALGEGKPAKRFAVRSLQMNEGYERGRLFNTVLLARIYADAGELDRAGWRHIPEGGLVAPKSAVGRRAVPIALVLVRHLRKLRHVGAGSFVFGREDGCPFAPSSVLLRAETAWTAAKLEPIGLPSVGTHSRLS